MIKTLSIEAQNVINQYLNFPIGNITVSIPYFNNKRTKVRAGLRVLIGKGSPEDIKEEVEIICLKNKINKQNITKNEAKKILIDNQIGIDCSGFVYHVLNAEMKAQGKEELKTKLRFPNTTNIIRKIIRHFRAIENIDVKLFASDKNSQLVELKNIQPGDMIVLIDAGYAGTVDHIMLVESIEYKEGQPIKIQLVHSFAWSSDGPLNHGVRRAEINIIDIAKSILEQKWIEQEKNDKHNETLKRAKEAKRVEIRRI